MNRMNLTAVTGCLLFGSLMAIEGCKKEESHAKTGQSHWGYEGEHGPANWGTLHADFSQCATGNRQSPIDIQATGDRLPAGQHKTEFNYAPAKPQIENNGHTIQLSFEDAGVFRFDGKEHRLKQFHFHTPSENTVNGKRYPMELHMVHMSPRKELLVVGILFEEGASHDVLASFAEHLPQSESKQALDTAIDLPALIGQNPSFYHFQGSLTTPPCSEGVRWLVRTATATASAQQIGAIRDIVGGNARPVQTLGDRKIELN